MFQQLCREIVDEAIAKKVRTVEALNRVKMHVLNKHPEIAEIPNNADLIVSATPEQKAALKNVLVMKPMRTISGVSPIAMMCDPYPCPHTMKKLGPCTYCPGGPGSPWGDVPQSYTGAEPSTRRSARNHYDPYISIFNRLEHYIAMNHSPEKVEVILQGGTFPFFPKHYQEYFIKYIFKAMNDFSRVFYPQGELDFDRFTAFFELPIQHEMDERVDKVHQKCLFLKNLDLRDAVQYDSAIHALFQKTIATQIIDDNHNDSEHYDNTTNKNSLRHGHQVSDATNKEAMGNTRLGNGLQAIELIEKQGEGHDANVRAMKRAIAKVNTLDDKRITLEQMQTENETAKIRCVGLTIETKSDYGKLLQGNEMLRLGCTRVELGIQTIYDDVLEKTHRGNTVQDNIDSIRILKDLGFKINAHIMPGLPHTTEEMDKIMLRTIFESPDYRPDMLKIYPCMVLEGTKLYEDFKKGLFTPLTTQQAAQRIAWFKKFVPQWVRIMRIQRDIPSYMTEGGVDKTNLRQFVEIELKNQGIKCRCIRCREPGHQKTKPKSPARTAVKIIEYEASQGKEFFIAFEDMENDVLLGYARLRFPSQSLREEITPHTALLRELHVFGRAIPVGERDEEGLQHKGIGKMLLQKAEEICKANEKDKIVVISGVGVREYYRKIGYSLEGPYMVKFL
jgi:elongator complex protein 3